MIREITYPMLCDVPLFKNMSFSELQPVLDVCEIREYPADVLILRAGESDRGLYVMLDGEAEVRFETLIPEGESVGMLYRNSVFGESSFFHASPHHANVVATSHCTVLRLCRDAYDRLLAEGNLASLRMAANAAEILAKRLQATDEWVVQMLRQKEDTAIAHSWARFRSNAGQGINFQPGFVGVRGAG